MRCSFLRCVPTFEVLEKRLVLDGSVRVFPNPLNRADLLVVGDNAANVIGILQSEAGTVTIEAAPGTKLNGVDGGSFSGPLKGSVLLRMKGNDDEVDVIGSTTFRKNLVVDLGTGNNSFTVSGGNFVVPGQLTIVYAGQKGQTFNNITSIAEQAGDNLTVGKKLAITSTGNNNDDVDVGNSTGSTNIGGNMETRLFGGSNNFRTDLDTIGGDMRTFCFAEAFGGSDDVFIKFRRDFGNFIVDMLGGGFLKKVQVEGQAIHGDTVIRNTARSDEAITSFNVQEFLGNVSVTSRAQIVDTTISSATIFKNLTIQALGADISSKVHADKVQVVGKTTVKSTTTASASSSIEFTEFNGVGATNVTSGEANDTFVIDDSVFNGLTVNTGNGGDTMLADTDAAYTGRTEFRGPLTIIYADGNDDVVLGGQDMGSPDPTREVLIDGKALLNGGSGTNFLSETNVVLGPNGSLTKKNF